MMKRLSLALFAATFHLAAPVPSTFAGEVCPPDINNDSQVNVTDLLAVINSWGPCATPSLCASDIAPLGGNSKVDVDDLLNVIQNWGICLNTCLPQNNCLQAHSLWCDNFELGNFTRWTGGYGAESACEQMGFVTDHAHSATKSYKSRILCSTPGSHRGYGGLRFQGEAVVPHFALPSTGGIDAPHGIVATMWTWIDSAYTFDSTRWVSLLTATHDCSNNWAGVVTLNIDDPSMRLKPVHVSSVTYAPNAPAFPRGQWNRITVYMNYYNGSMHVWQNGAKVVSATFAHPTNTICQFHFGLYASGQNDNVTRYEDDYSIVKLTQPMTNFTAEPQFPNVVSPCGIVGQ